MSFPLVPKSMTLNDLERRNGPYFALFHRIFVYDAGPPGIPVPGNRRFLKFPAGIPGNLEDFPKLSFFLDSDASILRKTRLFRITFR